MGPAPSEYCLDFYEMIKCDLELRDKYSLFLLSCFFKRIFYYINRNEPRTVGKLFSPLNNCSILINLERGKPVKSNCCYSRGSEISSQHPHRAAHNNL